MEFHRLIRRQSIIGWNQIVRGKFVAEWREAQHQCWSRAGRTPTTKETQWLSFVISLIFQQCHALWLQRNKARHGDDSATRAAAQRRQAERELRELYKAQASVQEEDRGIFRASVEVHLEESTRAIQNWMQVHRGLILHSAKRAHREAVRCAPPITRFFPVIQRSPSSLPSSSAGHASRPPPIPRRHRRRCRSRGAASPTSSRLTAYFPTVHLARHRGSEAYRAVSPALDSDSAPLRPRQRKLGDFWPDHPS